MFNGSAFWNRDVYRLVAAVCLLFMVITALAMLLYPGGTPLNHAARHYAFFDNFFSDLGQTRTPSGQSNILSLVLFVAALVTVAIGLVLFFTAFVGFFTGRRRRLTRVGSIFGILTAVCFVGVAATPWDLYLTAHNTFVKIAFPSFLVAVLLYSVAILQERTVPARFAWVFLGFAVILACYVVLILVGPSPKTSQSGRIIQATGQKIIVYASVVTVLIQSLAAQALRAGRDSPTPAEGPIAGTLGDASA